MNQKIKSHLLEVYKDSNIANDILIENIYDSLILEPEIYSKIVDKTSDYIEIFKVVNYHGLTFGFSYLKWKNFSEILDESFTDVVKKVKIIEQITYEPKN